MLLTGAEILVRSLIDQGVDTIFGYPGGAVLNIYDALYMHQDELRHVLTCHEQGAAHAADGYARSTGKVGVCLATSGPGATNLVTGIATAYIDSIPMVAITGNVTNALLGKDSFQEVDIKGITMPITKHNYIVKNVEELEETIREAFFIAQDGRPGPVLIDIPKDVTANKAEYVEYVPKKVTPKENSIKEADLAQAIKLINESKKPFIYAGGGVKISSACKEVKELADKIGAPVATSLMAMDSISNDFPLYTGMIGMHGTKASNLAATKCDLLIAIGARFSDRVISSQNHIKNAKVLHIDIDPAEINKNIKVDASVIGDAKIIVEKLLSRVDAKRNQEWLDKIEDIKKANLPKEESEALTPKYLFDKLNEMNDKGNIIISTEVGQHQMWAAQYFNFKKSRSFVTSGGLGTMGFGLGASIGVQVGNPDCQVINIAGDGSFGMNNNEIATAVSNKLPLIMIIINNGVLGMVRQWQDLFYEKRYSHTTLNRKTDFVKLAEAHGAKGYRVTKKEELDKVLKEAFESKEPVLIDYIIDMDKKAFPMVAPGAPIDNIITEEDFEK